MAKYKSFQKLAPFERNSNFIVRRKFRLLGKLYNDGDMVPKELFTTRRLRQLYEQRMIQAVPLDYGQEDQTKPDFKQMPTASLKIFLKENKCTPRTSWMRDKLIEKAEQIWEKENGVPVTQSDTERDQ